MIDSVQTSYIKSNQQGIGLVEVLVALLLLAIGVIGFAGLQVRAVSATNEAFQRGQAMVLARDMGERIRVNLNARDFYNTTANWQVGTPQPVSTYTPNCVTSACTAQQLAQFDINEVRLMALAIGANGQARMQTCPSNTALRCLYVSWGNTQPQNATAADSVSCTLNGSFQPGSNCIMLETY